MVEVIFLKESPGGADVCVCGCGRGLGSFAGRVCSVASFRRVCSYFKDIFVTFTTLSTVRNHGHRYKGLQIEIFFQRAVENDCLFVYVLLEANRLTQ